MLKSRQHQFLRSMSVPLLALAVLLICGAAEGEREAFVLIATSQPEVVRALVVARSLRAVGTSKEVILLVNSNGFPARLRELATAEFSEVQEVALPEQLVPSYFQLQSAIRSDILRSLATVFAWRMTNFQKLVLLGENVLVVGNSDSLFQKTPISALADKGTDGEVFSSSVVVLEPSIYLYNQLMRVLRDSQYTLNDESVLNSVFVNWHELDEAYLKRELVLSEGDEPQPGYNASSKMVELFDEPAVWTDLYDVDTEELKTDPKLQQSSARRLWWRLFAELQEDFAKSIAKKEENRYPDVVAKDRFLAAKRKRGKFSRARRSGCTISCKRGSCSCQGTCMCRCGWWSKPVCT